MTFDPTPPVFRDPDRLERRWNDPSWRSGTSTAFIAATGSSWGSPARWLEGWRSHGAVLTFEPHSRAYIRADEQLFPLCSLADKLKLLAREELDGVVILGFNAALARLSAAAFVESLSSAVSTCRASPSGRTSVSARTGSATPHIWPAEARNWASKPPCCRRSWSAGRECPPPPSRSDIMVGRVEKAAAMLGHYWFVGGPVVSGPGEPPWIAINPACTIAYGLYAVRVAAQGQVRDAVATRSPASRTGRPCFPSRCSMGSRISATERSRSNSSPGSERMCPSPRRKPRAERLSRDRTEAIQALSAARSDETIESVLPSSPRQ